jgi:hypothetical protein
MVEIICRLAFLAPDQVGLNAGDKFGKGIGEAGHDAAGG